MPGNVMRLIMAVRIHLLRFAAFTFGKQLMVTAVSTKKPTREDRQAEQDRCIHAMLVSVDAGDIEAMRAYARVFLTIKRPEWDDFAHHDSIGQAIWYQHYSMEYDAFREVAEYCLEDSHDAR